MILKAERIACCKANTMCISARNTRRSVQSTRCLLVAAAVFMPIYGCRRTSGYVARHPILLPKHHPGTEAIITHYHTTILGSEMAMVTMVTAITGDAGTHWEVNVPLSRWDCEVVRHNMLISNSHLPWVHLAIGWFVGCWSCWAPLGTNTQSNQ